jgi:hypothetical protein
MDWIAAILVLIFRAWQVVGGEGKRVLCRRIVGVVLIVHAAPSFS